MGGIGSSLGLEEPELWRLHKGEIHLVLSEQHVVLLLARVIQMANQIFFFMGSVHLFYGLLGETIIIGRNISICLSLVLEHLLRINFFFTRWYYIHLFFFFSKYHSLAADLHALRLLFSVMVDFFFIRRAMLADNVVSGGRKRILSYVS